jgi:hypothetical protein
MVGTGSSRSLWVGHLAIEKAKQKERNIGRLVGQRRRPIQGYDVSVQNGPIYGAATKRRVSVTQCSLWRRPPAIQHSRMLYR